jgi:acyl-CoA reductase-like NAD-dependent aldehyde dehydrogenase
VEKANALEYGLQCAIHTRDYKMALTLARKIHAGSVIINESTDSDGTRSHLAAARRPGSGEKASGTPCSR